MRWKTASFSGSDVAYFIQLKQRLFPGFFRVVGPGVFRILVGPILDAWRFPSPLIFGRIFSGKTTPGRSFKSFPPSKHGSGQIISKSLEKNMEQKHLEWIFQALSALPIGFSSRSQPDSFEAVAWSRSSRFWDTKRWLNAGLGG